MTCGDEGRYGEVGGWRQTTGPAPGVPPPGAAAVSVSCRCFGAKIVAWHVVIDRANDGRCTGAPLRFFAGFRMRLARGSSIPTSLAPTCPRDEPLESPRGIGLEWCEWARRPRARPAKRRAREAASTLTSRAPAARRGLAQDRRRRAGARNAGSDATCAHPAGTTGVRMPCGWRCIPGRLPVYRVVAE